MLMLLARHEPKEIIYCKIRGWISAASLRGKVCNWINLWIACLHSCVNTKTSHIKSSPGTGPVNMRSLQTHCVIFTHRTMLWLRSLYFMKSKYYEMQNYYRSKIGNIQIQLCDVFVWIYRRTWMKRKMHISITAVVISGVPYETSNLSVCYRVKPVWKRLTQAEKLKMESKFPDMAKWTMYCFYLFLDIAEIYCYFIESTSFALFQSVSDSVWESKHRNWI